MCIVLIDYRAVAAGVSHRRTDRLIIIIIIIIIVVVVLVVVVEVECDALLDGRLAERRAGGGQKSVGGPQDPGPGPGPGPDPGPGPGPGRRRSVGHQDLVGLRPSTVVAAAPLDAPSAQLQQPHSLSSSPRSCIAKV